MIEELLAELSTELSDLEFVRREKWAITNYLNPEVDFKYLDDVWFGM